MRKVRRLLAMATVATTLTATVLTGCGKADEPATDVVVEDTVEDTTETGKKVVLADTEKDENREIGVVQSKENIEAETDVEQATQEFVQQFEQNNANTENPFAGGFTIAGSGDDIDWNQQSTWGDNVVIH